jgi:hypothetical protein
MSREWTKTNNLKIYKSDQTKEMHKYRILFQSLHLHVSVYMTILRVLIEYISVVMCKVQYIYTYLQYDVKTEHRVVAKKLKSVKILMCRVCWCVHCVVIRWRHTGHINILTNFNFLAITRFLFLHHIIVSIGLCTWQHWCTLWALWGWSCRPKHVGAVIEIIGYTIFVHFVGFIWVVYENARCGTYKTYLKIYYALEVK